MNKVVVAVGAITKVRIEAYGLIGGTRTRLRPFLVTLPARRLDRKGLDAVHREFREQFKGGPANVSLLEYRLLSEDGTQVYAEWQRVDDDNQSS